MSMMLRKLLLSLAVLPALLISMQTLANQNNKEVPGLKNVTVLIVRHAEKPDQGMGLSPRGEQRAEAYAHYFDPLQLGSKNLVPQRLIATSDSKSSARPRLTLTPLSQRLHLPIEQPYADEEVDKLVKSLDKNNQASVVLIAWHHGHIDNLIEAFGGDGQALTGQKSWPEDVYDWLIVLRFDDQGNLVESHSKKIQEHLLPGDGS
ncbi:flagellar basal body-associated protein FliL [Pseudomonas sp. FW306-02-F02-AA]|uniref:Flagellar basal body-associated protein FliL n=2 Tax=Pseudomonas TaxID=286 RepID=A0A0N9VW50_PSEFL|nr:flagellar basal body-associated protein FliL [Pseudomonas fluorescens]PMZ02280.1 flagellar basal body-associated protein FliL [Pseudomonas sp. FW306-02-F02-AB]PMZ08210.1 flagellar basal body-associated protein FliL [Pseudomonas sp. FW306-02-H06C]PMZ16922.1 flagellar basal body-associated protein FliL [Pseudomonas sp. FW306-02-F02-AA]PMZ20129.1 flagellar basal body-associated protein FliL [Pseudomonas sp. FW306-02-F08-AA]PMZ28722.1 flagellar basal body-associated protein FliL [Pseudomonas sp